MLAFGLNKPRNTFDTALSQIQVRVQVQGKNGLIQWLIIFLSKMFSFI
jgi:hypothetical protein